MKVKRQFLLFSMFLFALLFFIKPANVHAQAVNYQTVKYGSNQTSMADGYYLRPAQVKVQGDKYYVTMTIRTKKGLSAWPVKVLTVAGQNPVNVTKTKYSDGYDYNYSFVSDLKGRVNSYISINVPGVYKANHNISFIFDQKQLPKLGSKNSGKKTRTEKVEKNNGQNSNDNQAPVSQASDNSKELAAANKQLAVNNKRKIQNQKNEQLYYYTLLLGILLIIIIAIVCWLTLHIAHKKVKDK